MVEERQWKEERKDKTKTPEKDKPAKVEEKPKTIFWRRSVKHGRI